MANLKIPAFLMFAMVTLHCGISDNMDSIEGNCNDFIRLPCKASERTKAYRYVMWYKSKTAIIKKKDEKFANFNNNTHVSLGEKEALELHNVQPSDSGVYKCYLAAVAGSTNDESFIRLNISECLPVTVTVFPSTAISTDSCPAVEELTVSWAVLGLSLFSIGKIILCIVAVGVCDRVIFSSARRKQEVRGSKTGTSLNWKD